MISSFYTCTVSIKIWAKEAHVITADCCGLGLWQLCVIVDGSCWMGSTELFCALRSVATTEIPQSSSYSYSSRSKSLFRFAAFRGTARHFFNYRVCANRCGILYPVFVSYQLRSSPGWRLILLSCCYPVHAYERFDGTYCSLLQGSSEIVIIIHKHTKRAIAIVPPSWSRVPAVIERYRWAAIAQSV